jgi:tetratricopeptide (TPR) repeat protein
MQSICDRATSEKPKALSRELEKGLQEIGPGFSALQDDLLERAQLIRGNLLMREDLRDAAWLAYQSARFYRPGRGLSEKLRGKLLSANARPEEALTRVARSRLLAGPSSLQGRLLALEQERLLRETKALQNVEASLARGQTALLGGDWKTAKAFAQRSLNLVPGNSGGLRLLASAQELSGALKSALSTQLRVVAHLEKSPEQIQNLAVLLQKNGRPHLALGRLLKIALHHPNVLSTDLARRVYASVHPFDQLRQVRVIGEGKSLGVRIPNPGFASMLLLASPLGSLGHKPIQGTLPETQLPEPYSLDLGPGIRTGQPSNPGR